MGNSFIFLVPHCNYTRKSLDPFYHGIPVQEEVYSSKREKTTVIKRTIPSLLIRTSIKSKYLIVYLHGNSEDLGRMYPYLLSYYEQFQIDILAPEYPGYGIYKDQTNAVRMVRDAQHIIDYATHPDGLNYPAENIILMGRSLGTGVAIQLAARCPYLKGMILVSAFTSVRDVAKNSAGSISKLLIPNIFQSYDIISEVKVPVLFIHGKDDEMIPFAHSVKLCELLGSSKKRLELRKHMSHNRCNEAKDIIRPIEKFLVEDLQIQDLGSLCIKQQKLPKESEKIPSPSMMSMKCNEVSGYQSIINEEKVRSVEGGILPFESVEKVDKRQVFLASKDLLVSFE